MGSGGSGAVVLREMSIGDYDEVMALWRGTEGMGLSDADSLDNIRRYLERNPGMSFVAATGGVIVGAALCGHDGRRGYLHHLAVEDRHRKEGLGSRLMDACLASLAENGITKCHIHVFRANEEGAGFWRAAGWNRRDDLWVMSREIRNKGWV